MKREFGEVEIVLIPLIRSLVLIDDEELERDARENIGFNPFNQVFGFNFLGLG